MVAVQGSRQDAVEGVVGENGGAPSMYRIVMSAPPPGDHTYTRYLATFVLAACSDPITRAEITESADPVRLLQRRAGGQIQRRWL
jgi:hypothetical protein